MLRVVVEGRGRRRHLVRRVRERGGIVAVVVVNWGIREGGLEMGSGSAEVHVDWRRRSKLR